MDGTVRVIGDSRCPMGWSVLVDDNRDTVCIVLHAPVFRVIFGDPNSDRISAVKVPTVCLAQYARQQAYAVALDAWEPQGAVQ